jgi:hypothetical protein
MKRVIALLFVLALAAGAQENTEKVWLQKVFDVKYADPQGLAKLVAGVMQSNTTRIRENVELRAISVGTYLPADMRAAEELIKRFDVPRAAPAVGSSDIELTFYILTAAHQGAAGEALPADLDSVARQLKNAFGYTDIRLLESGLLRAAEKRFALINGRITSPNSKFPGVSGGYTFSVKAIGVGPGQKGRVLHLDELHFVMNVPERMLKDKDGQPYVGHAHIELRSDLDIREGQKIVVGKTKAEGMDGAVFLVLTARVVD